MKPREVPVVEALGWLLSVLPTSPARVLEVGCGRGDLALRLRDLGYDVVPLDRAPDAVGLARAAGLDVVESDFLEYTAEPFDVVLFTRSLHHIHPLSEAIEKAGALVKEDGLVVGDEFARERIDAETARWYADTTAVLREVGMLPDEEDDPAADPLERWRARFLRHDPPPTTGADMLNALASRFELVEVHQRVPYLYRYAADRLPESAAGVRLTRLLLEIERRRIAMSSPDQPWTGLRFVARPRL